jgi:ATP-dependent Zn protease
MGLNFRKSVKIADGVKLNIGKKSAGVSVGGKYAGASFNTKSGARVRASLPGTGLSYTKSLNSIGKKSSSSKKKSKNSAKSILSTVLTVLIVIIAVIFIVRKNWSTISETLGLNQTAVETTTTTGLSDAASDSTIGTAAGQDTSVSYVINTSTKKVHVTTCRYADATSANVEETSESLDELLADGYSKCGTCMK